MKSYLRQKILSLVILAATVTASEIFAAPSPNLTDLPNEMVLEILVNFGKIGGDFSKLFNTGNSRLIELLQDNALNQFIVPVASNDPRVSAFPEFKKLGQMYKLGKILISGVGPVMSHQEAIDFCRDLDGARYTANGAHLPSLYDLNKLWESLGKDRSRIPSEWRGQILWSSEGVSGSQYDYSDTQMGEAMSFGGSYGFYGTSQYSAGAVVCVRSIPSQLNDLTFDK